MDKVSFSKSWIVFISFFLLHACVISPAEHSNDLALESGFDRQVFTGINFRHVVYTSNLAGKGSSLHVYLEGDGVPWVTEKIIARDPTSRKPVMLPLMAMDNNPAIYLGRPCYQGLFNDPGCGVSVWTFGRYSRQIVNSMTEVIRQILAQHGFASVRLFGHSGGGTIASLIAQTLPETQVVVTLGGNMDIDAWAEYHRYTPLYDSLSPAKTAPLNSAIRQFHLQAGKDEIVPPHIVSTWFKQQRTADVCIYPEFDHRCCWKEIWPKVLGSISRADTTICRK